MSRCKVTNQWNGQKKNLVYSACPVNSFYVLCNSTVYGTELSPKFLERRSVSGLILPAAAHNPGDFHGAALWSRHTVSWNTSQTVKAVIEIILAHCTRFQNSEECQNQAQCRSRNLPQWHLNTSTSKCLIWVFTFLHLVSCLLVGHARVGRHSHGEGLPQ